MSAQQTIYRAGIYLRLSKDDESKGESSSISNQRSILKDYAKAHDIFIEDEYIDDGDDSSGKAEPEEENKFL